MQSPSFIRRDEKRAESVMITINRATLVSVQPSAVTAKRNQISQRGMILVKVGIVCAHPQAPIHFTDRYGTGSGSDLAPREISDLEAPGRYYSPYRLH